MKQIKDCIFSVNYNCDNVIYLILDYCQDYREKYDKVIEEINDVIGCNYTNKDSKWTYPFLYIFTIDGKQALAKKVSNLVNKYVYGHGYTYKEIILLIKIREKCVEYSKQLKKIYIDKKINYENCKFFKVELEVVVDFRKRYKKNFKNKLKNISNKTLQNTHIFNRIVAEELVKKYEKIFKDMCKKID